MIKKIRIEANTSMRIFLFILFPFNYSDNTHHQEYNSNYKCGNILLYIIASDCQNNKRKRYQKTEQTLNEP